MFPSLADSARTSTSPASPNDRSRVSDSLYPDLSALATSQQQGMEREENDVLAGIGVPPAKPKPPRPPNPKKGYSTPVMGSPNLSTKGSLEMSEILSVPRPLYPHEVRWFYQKPGKYWQPFGGHDSLYLENCYLRLMELVVSQGMKEQEVEGEEWEVTVLGDLYLVKVGKRTLEPIYWTDKEKWKVLRGYWFEVAADNWYPFSEADYAMIEQEHCNKKWREKAIKDAELQTWAKSSSVPSGLSKSGQSTRSASLPSAVDDANSGPVLVNTLNVGKFTVLWMDNGDVYKVTKELTTQLLNKVGEKLGKGAFSGKTKLKRGYREHASGEDRMPPIGHIVFVVHGIGQNMDISSIEKNTTDFREVCAKVAKKNFPDRWNEKRVEFLPVEWRTSLSLDEGLVAKITPHGLKMMRDLINDCVLDVFYYFSPRYGPEIKNGLKTSLHKQYNEFMRRHPHFLSSGGTVSTLAHSLGSVMMYDLLREKCQLDPNLSSSIPSVPRGEGAKVADVLTRAEDESDSSEVKMSAECEDSVRCELEDLRKRVAYLEHQLVLKCPPVPLCFGIDHFFALGSPMALFIAMREHNNLIIRDHRCTASILPSAVCKRIHNLHHPSDPIAYRLEPLVNPLYSQVRPVKVDSAGSKISKEAVDHAEGMRQTKQQPQQQQQKSWWSSSLQNMGQSLISMATKKSSSPVMSERTQVPEKVVDCDKHLHEDDKLKERLDFMLKEGLIENSYLNSLTAHNSYWTSSDCAKYILLQLYSYKHT